MKTNETIFASIKLTCSISESDLKLLKNRSNKAGKDLFDYDLIDEVYNRSGEYGVKLSPEQGEKGLRWLKSFISKRDPQTTIRGASYGFRELEIINSASPEDFRFVGFWDAGIYCRCFLPIYNLNGMEYVPLKTPYIVG